MKCGNIWVGHVQTGWWKLCASYRRSYGGFIVVNTDTYAGGCGGGVYSFVVTPSTNSAQGGIAVKRLINYGSVSDFDQLRLVADGYNTVEIHRTGSTGGAEITTCMFYGVYTQERAYCYQSTTSGSGTVVSTATLNS